MVCDIWVVDLRYWQTFFEGSRYTPATIQILERAVHVRQCWLNSSFWRFFSPQNCNKAHHHPSWWDQPSCPEYPPPLINPPDDILIRLRKKNSLNRYSYLQLWTHLRTPLLKHQNFGDLGKGQVASWQSAMTRLPRLKRDNIFGDPLGGRGVSAECNLSILDLHKTQNFEQKIMSRLRFACFTIGGTSKTM